MTKQNLLYILLFSMALAGCSGEYDNPGGIIPPEDLLNAIYTDTTSIKAHIEKDDTVYTSTSNRGMLGSYYDPVFGRTSSSFFTTFNTGYNQILSGGQGIVDSVVLVLRADGVYGDATKYNSYQVAEVYEVTDKIPVPGDDDNGYSSYNLNDFHYNPVPIGVQGFAPQFFTFNNEPAQLRIRLNNSIGERFMQLDTIKPDTIQHFLKGIYVKISDNTINSQAPKQGAICYFNLASDVSKIVIYLHTPSIPTSFPLNLVSSGSGNVHFSVYKHQFNTSTDPGFSTKLSDTTDASVQYLYAQSLQGIRTHIRFPGLMNLIDTQSVIINKAELIIPVDDINQDLTLYPPSANILTYRYTDDGLIQPFTDLSYSYYDSYYDSDNKQFRVVITQYLQKIISGDIPNDGFYLDIPIGNKNTDAYRVVFHSPQHATRPMKLNLIYTRIQN